MPGADTIENADQPAVDGRITAAENKVKESNAEAASYRVQRNAALKKQTAYETILKAHNIDASAVNDDSLRGLKIENGAVVGTFDYAPPKVVMSAPEPRMAGQAAQPLTKADLHNMTEEQIANRWNEVFDVLRNG